MLRFTDSLHRGSKGASGLRVHLRLRTHQDIGGTSESQGLPDPKATDAKEVSEKNTTKTFGKNQKALVCQGYLVLRTVCICVYLNLS